MTSTLTKKAFQANMLSDSVGKRLEMLLVTTWYGFVIRYRRTTLGPLWVVFGPAIFIAVLGGLFSRVNNADQSLFIPHLAVGIVTWTLLHNIVSSSTHVFQSKRAHLLQGGMSQNDIVSVNILTELLQFAHLTVVILVTLLYYKVGFTWYSLVSLLGVFIIALNGLWLGHFLGILGARYPDMREMATAALRIAFLATPIMWLPTDRGGIVAHFLNFNPFYHYMQLVRAPLLGQTIEPLTWLVVAAMTVIGGLAAWGLRARFSRYVVLWV